MCGSSTWLCAWKPRQASDAPGAGASARGSPGPATLRGGRLRASQLPTRTTRTAVQAEAGCCVAGACWCRLVPLALRTPADGEAVVALALPGSCGDAEDQLGLHRALPRSEMHMHGRLPGQLIRSLVPGVPCCVCWRPWSGRGGGRPVLLCKFSLTQLSLMFLELRGDMHGSCARCQAILSHPASRRP
mgnify:CR=1 FL=1